MEGLQALDAALFRSINLGLSNSVLDRVMPFFGDNPFFVPAVAALILGLLWKGRRRGRVYVLMLALALVIGDGVICNSLKKGIARPRPFNTVLQTRTLHGRTGSGSMPSAHAANWFAFSMITALYFRRFFGGVLAVACLVAFSRVYTGMHYPSDVLVGALLGTTYATLIAVGADKFWRTVGRRWFPLWWVRMPSLLQPEYVNDELADLAGDAGGMTSPSALEQHWTRLGYFIIFAFFLIRLNYLAAGKIELSEDEAYQWLWSKHPALSYFSKPPMIAYAQFVGTHLWGDTAFGVRFLSPLIGAALGLMLFRFLRREVSVRTAFAFLLALTATPLLAVGATLLTIDPLSVLFWTAAMICGWRAIERDSTRLWVWTGLFMGLGFLSKYTALFQLLCWLVFFVLWRPARAQLKRPGPYLALVVLALCTVPVLVWNNQHGWITVTHLANRGGLDQAWEPSLRFFWDFVLAEVGLLHPVFVLGALWAAVGIWFSRKRSALVVFLFSMGVPLFLFYFLYTFRARVQPNWIAPSVLPMFCLMMVYWRERVAEGWGWIKPVFAVAVAGGCLGIILLHDTNLVGKIAHRPLPARLDPLARVRGWTETAAAVGQARQKLLGEGKPVFIIGNHYGITSLISFYLPEAKAGVPDHPLAYYQRTPTPQNQFFFWPSYGGRRGENAIYVMKADEPQAPPESLKQEFQSVVDLGMTEVFYRGRVLRRIQMFECRGLL